MELLLPRAALAPACWGAQPTVQLGAGAQAEMGFYPVIIQNKPGFTLSI